MKKPIEWALVRGYSGSGIGFKIIAITSYKGELCGYRSQYYGRDDGGYATHGKRSDIVTTFETEELAKGSIRRAFEARKCLLPAVEDAREAYQNLDREMTKAIERAARGLKNDDHPELNFES